jgi:hypothetical protein
MADQREFVLIGSFEDRISPAIEKINNSINGLKKNLSGFAVKSGGFNDLTRSMGKVIGAHKILNTEIANLRKELRTTIPLLREYRREVGKTVGANMRLSGKGFSAKNNPYLQYLKEATTRTKLLARETQRAQAQSRPSRSGGGGGTYNVGGGGGGRVRPPRPLAGGGARPPRPPSAGSTFGTTKFGVSRDAQFAFGQTLGYTLGSTITNAVTQGFQIGVGILEKPFQYLASAFGERIKDELDDLKAAGGLYSVSKRSKNPFLKNIDEAIDFQQETNSTFAKMAASLPGVTNDYVQVGKRLSDTAARIVSTDFAEALQDANKIRSTEEGRKFYGGQITGTGAESQREVIKTILGELTKKSTLAGLGGRSGAGGIAGAYGLPGLVERMISEDQVSIGKFQRYAAVFSDPMIADALYRNVAEINKTQKGTMDRARALNKLLDEIVTPELVDKLRVSFDGIYQGLRSAILDPDEGLLGLGRNFEKFGKKINSYGQYVDAAGNVVTDLEKAADADLSIFEILRDIFVNTGQVLTPIIENLKLIFDPLKNVANVLMDARHYTAEFARTFNEYRDTLKQMSKFPGNEFILDTLDFRASLAAITNLLFQFKAIGKTDFDRIAGVLSSKDADLGKILQDLIDRLLNSDIAEQIGDFIGRLVGTIVSQMADIVGFFAGTTEKSSKLVEGLKKGFYAAKGPEAVRSIFQNLFQALFTGIFELFKIMPMELGALLAIQMLLPAFVSSFSVLLANRLQAMLTLAEAGFKKSIGEFSFDKARSTYLFGRAEPNLPRFSPTQPGNPATQLSMGPRSAAFRTFPQERIVNAQFPQVALGMKPGLGGVTGPYRAPSLPTMPKALVTGKGLKVQIVSVANNAFSKTTGFLGGAGKFLGAGGLEGLKNPLGMLGKFGTALTVVTGLINGIVTLVEGGSIWKALGATAGPIAGTIIGTAIAGPIGGIIGGFLGSLDGVSDTLGQIFEWIGDSFNTFVTTLGFLGSDILDIVKSLTGAKSDIQAFQQIMVSLKIAFFPVLATLDLVNVALISLHIALIELQMFIDDVTGGKNREKLAEQYKEANKLLIDTVAANDEKYASMSRRTGDKGEVNGKQMVWNGWRWVTPEEFKKTGYGSFSPTSAAKTAAGAPGASTGIPGLAAAGPTAESVATSLTALDNKTAVQVTNSNNLTKNTSTANNLLGNIRDGIVALNNRFNLLQINLGSVYQLLASGNLTVKTAMAGIPGLGGGSPMGGGVDSFTSIAQAYGLSMTSGYRPGDPGWHGANRARDYAGSSGQMMQFAQYMAFSQGGNLRELLYTPLGFSIRNGTKVAPYAQAAHYNHVHVAYATGLPTFFGSQQEAINWENKATLGNVKVSSITARQGEFGNGASVSINAPITIHQQPGQDSEELAAIVAMKIGDAVAQARASSIFV